MNKFPVATRSIFGSIILVLITFCFLACSENNAEADKINEDIMKSHDEAMHKMGEIEHLKQNLKQYKDLTPDDNALKKDSLINGILILSKAHDNMQDWMSSYDFEQPNMDQKQKIAYLKAQQDSVKIVGDNIFMSIGIANGLLKNAPDSLRK